MQIVTPSIKISPPKAKSRLSPPAFCFLISCFVHGLLIVTLPIVHEFCIFPPQSSCIIIIAEGKPLQDNNSIHKISPPKAKSRLSPPAFCFFILFLLFPVQRQHLIRRYADLLGGAIRLPPLKLYPEEHFFIPLAREREGLRQLEGVLY